MGLYIKKENNNPSKKKFSLSKIKLLIVLGTLIIACIVLILLLVKCSPKKNNPKINITWSSDTFQYDGSLHTVSVTNAPTGSTVTYTGGEDGSNGSINPGTYDITATIINSNHTWTSSSQLHITHSLSSYLVLQDGTKYTIDTSGTFCTDRTGGSASAPFTFTDCDGVDQSITRADIKEIYITNLSQITTAPNNYLKFLCTYMTNLAVADVLIPNTITSVGDNFCQNMFSDCTNLTTVASSLNIPQGITNVGAQFCRYMFLRCTSLVFLPTGFNFPQQMISIGGDSCCQEMFQYCSSLASLPYGFNLSQNLTSAGMFFCQGMFQYCSSLKNDNQPENLVTINIPSLSGTNFCRNMFGGCTGLTGVPTSPSPGDNININAN